MSEGTPGSREPQLSGVKRVLLADDNDRYAEVLTHDLEKRGVDEVIRAYTADEAVRILEAEGDSIGAVVSDISMETQISGLKVLRAARKGTAPRIVAVATTGLDSTWAYRLNYVILGLLYRADYLIKKRPIKQEGKVVWIPVRS